MQHRREFISLIFGLLVENKTKAKVKFRVFFGRTKSDLGMQLFQNIQALFLNKQEHQYKIVPFEMKGTKIEH